MNQTCRNVPVQLGGPAEGSGSWSSRSSRVSWGGWVNEMAGAAACSSAAGGGSEWRLSGAGTAVWWWSWAAETSLRSNGLRSELLPPLYYSAQSDASLSQPMYNPTQHNRTHNITAALWARGVRQRELGVSLSSWAHIGPDRAHGAEHTLPQMNPVPVTSLHVWY